MHFRLRLLSTLVVLILLFSACAGGPEPDDPVSRDVPAETEPEEPEPEEQEPEDAMAAEDDAEEPIEVSEEVYEQTFDEIEATIEELNAVIGARDFDGWKTYLTEAYVEEYSDSERLAEISEMPILQRNDVTLTSLRDYFDWVVVPSRQDARLDDLRFLSENEVDAVMEINGDSVILYRLRKIDGRWKVDAA